MEFCGQIFQGHVALGDKRKWQACWESNSGTDRAKTWFQQGGSLTKVAEDPHDSVAELLVLHLFHQADMIAILGKVRRSAF